MTKRTRDILTIIGAFGLSLGPIVTSQARDRTEWWIGLVATSLGGALLGARGVKSTDEPK